MEDAGVEGIIIEGQEAERKKVLSSKVSVST